MPNRVDRSWGHELIIVNDEQAGYCGKVMVMDEGGRSTIERHGKKDETFYVLSGCVIVETFGQDDAPREGAPISYRLQHGDSHRILPGTWHRFGAARRETVFVEFSTFHDDSDTEKW